MDKLKVKTLFQTTKACPTQWEGILEDGRAIHIKYKWGQITVRTAPTPEGINDVAPLISKQYGKAWDSCIDFDTLKAKTDDILDLSEIDETL